MGDRPRALPSAAAARRQPGRARRPGPVGHHRRGARSDRRPARARSLPPGASCASRSPPASRPIADAALALARKYRDGSAARARSRWPFTHVHITLQHLGLTDEQAILFDRLASRVFGSDSSLHQPARSGAPTRSVSRICGATASRATCRSCWCACRRTRCRWCASCSCAGVLAGQGAARRPRHPQRAPGRLSRRDAELLTQLVQECRGAGSGNRAACSCCAPTAWPSRSPLCSRPSRAWCSPAISAICPSNSNAGAVAHDEPSAAAAGAVGAGAGGSGRRPVPTLVMRTASAASRRWARIRDRRLEGERETPLPWSNVLANRGFGTVVSSAGVGRSPGPATAARTGSRRSPTTRSDPTGEAFFLRDEDTGAVWGATPRRCRGAPGALGGPPRRGRDALSARRRRTAPGAGGLRAAGRSGEARAADAENLRATAAAQRLRLRRVVPRAAAQRRASVRGHRLCDRACWRRTPTTGSSPGAVAFFRASEPPRRTPAIATSSSAATARWPRRRRCSASGWPGVSVPASTRAGAAVASNSSPARRAESRSRSAREAIEHARSLARALRRRWPWTALRRDRADVGRLLGAVQVHTPDDSFDLIVNRWLLYQTSELPHLGAQRPSTSPAARSASATSCRTCWRWLCARPDLCRRTCCGRARQFVEGDVQHWWHPPSGAACARAAPTTCSGCRTASRTTWRDRRRAVLDEPVPFLEAPLLAPEQDETSTVPHVSTESAPLYEHCVRAIEHAMNYGAHGLPLIGSGDWNDGMNRVGTRARRERLAWLVPGHRAQRLRAASASGAAMPSWRSATATRRAGSRDARTGVGRRLVSPRLLRRRLAAGVGAERGVPDRLDGAVVGGDLGRGAAAPGRAGHERGRVAPGAPRRADRAAADAAVRSDGARSRLHQGLPAGHPRERRAVHARRCGR